MQDDINLLKIRDMFHVITQCFLGCPFHDFCFEQICMSQEVSYVFAILNIGVAFI